MYILPEPRHLHSFPTRRSSDLVGTCTKAMPRWMIAAAKPPRSPITPPPTATSTDWRSTFSSSRDRKSTRLNSSHLGISYAVFCLKKKRKQKIEHHLSLDATQAE